MEVDSQWYFLKFDVLLIVDGRYNENDALIRLF